METKQNLTKKRILYADGNNSGNVRCIQSLSDRLGVELIVEYKDWLDEKVKEIITQSRSLSPFDALITHMPPTRGAELRRLELQFPDRNIDEYGQSIDLVHQIKEENPSLPIMIYTGANNPYRFSSDDTDWIVEKSGYTEKDLDKIRDGLHYFFFDLPGIVQRRLKIASTPPNITRSASQSRFEVTLNNKNGLDAYLCARICKTVGKYEGMINVRDVSTGEEAGGKEMMNLMLLACGEGSQLEVSVSGQNKAAEDLARRLYSLLVSPTHKETRDDRFLV